MIRFFRAAATLAAAFAAAVALVAVPDVASADDGHVALSRDGVSYSTALSTSLFTDFGLIVPGDVRTATLWVKNESSGPALLRISGLNAVASSSTFANALSVRASDSASTGSTRTLTSIGSCLQLKDDEMLVSGETREITVDVSFADVGERLAATNTASVDIRTSLRDPRGGDLATTDCPPGATVPVLPPAVDPPVVDPPAVASPSAEGGAGAVRAVPLPNGVLAFTGSSPYSSIMFATIAIGTGGLLLAAARRRRRRRES